MSPSFRSKALRAVGPKPTLRCTGRGDPDAVIVDQLASLGGALALARLDELGALFSHHAQGKTLQVHKLLRASANRVPVAIGFDDAGIGVRRMHPAVLGELSCGGFRDRVSILADLRRLPRAEEGRFDEVLQMIESWTLYGKGSGGSTASYWRALSCPPRGFSLRIKPWRAQLRGLESDLESVNDCD